MTRRAIALVLTGALTVLFSVLTAFMAVEVSRFVILEEAMLASAGGTYIVWTLNLHAILRRSRQ